MVQGHTVRTSRLVRSAEVVALMVMGASHTPSEGVKRRARRHWAARTGSARPSWVGSCRHGSSRVRAAGITTLPGAKAAGLQSLRTGVMEVAMLLLLLVMFRCSIRRFALWPSPGCGTVHTGCGRTLT